MKHEHDIREFKKIIIFYVILITDSSEWKETK